MWNIFKNDWMVVWAKIAIWHITYTDTGNNVDKNCYYEILFSPSRNKYKIEMSGYRPKEHNAYPSIIEKYGTERL